MRPEQLQPVLEQLLVARRTRMENTQAELQRERLHFASNSRRNRRLAVQLFASSLAIDLFELDLDEIAGKYLGETEKHLDAFFTAAEAAGAVLLIDEADALLGKRTGVRDAHDRYANLDVDSLLQRLESYSGIVVLTTNRGAHIDAACARDCACVELSDD
jgi:AAA+ superfamily predicted ATPase